jgi:RNA polymerase sigma-70 factor (ECF subfamily)
MSLPLLKDIDEPGLIARSRKGDLAAFNILVERYQNPLYNLCFRMLGSREGAEDATQDAFISSYRNLERFRGEAFRPWLFRIAVNACYDELRRRRSRPAVSLDEPRGEGGLPIDVPSRSETPESGAERLELADALREALAALPHDQRLVVILRDVQGLEYAEIAQVTGTSLGTVKSRLNRARRRLCSLLRARGELLPARFRQSG